MTLDAALSGVTRLGLDTAPLVYFIEANPKYDTIVAKIFARIDRKEISAFSSAITLTEVLVQPLRLGRTDLVASYERLILLSGTLLIVDVDSVVAKRAAELRAEYSLRTPDALQIAAALHTSCGAFLTNDKSLKRVSEIRILVLEDLIAGG